MKRGRHRKGTVGGGVVRSTFNSSPVCTDASSTSSDVLAVVIRSPDIAKCVGESSLPKLRFARMIEA